MSESVNFQSTCSSVVGTNHKKIGQPCQDSCKIYTDSTILIAAIADGHGSPKCKYSASGSEQAVKTFIYFMHDLFIKFNDSVQFHSYLSGYHMDSLPAKICQQWENDVKKIHEDKCSEEEFDSVMYGSTLLGLIICPNFYFAFQLGDGDIISVGADGTTTRVIEYEKILGTETHSLSLKDAWRYSKTVIRYISNEEEYPDLFMLSTDGMSNSFVSDEDFLVSGNDYQKIIRQFGFSTVIDNLPTWLDEITNNGAGDDITLALISKNGTLLSKVEES